MLAVHKPVFLNSKQQMDLIGVINILALTIHAHAEPPHGPNPSTSISAQQVRDSSR
jgi:hypothetical protein